MMDDGLKGLKAQLQRLHSSWLPCGKRQSAIGKGHLGNGKWPDPDLDSKPEPEPEPEPQPEAGRPGSDESEITKPHLNLA
ncbi:GD15330 [Drosophila simulans]|uniref:GD15330 n=1 Tax=Drosophila simulans TaxID=7240 RepID=B4NS27_DROSI|nr:GD15330 [Drosophila simulans]